MFLWLASLTVICTVIATGFEVFHIGSAESMRTLWETAIMFFVSCSGAGMLQWIVTGMRAALYPFMRRHERQRGVIRVGFQAHVYEPATSMAVTTRSVDAKEETPSLWLKSVRVWGATGIFLCSAFLLPNLAKLELEHRLSPERNIQEVTSPVAYSLSEYAEPPMIGPANQPSSIVGWTFVPLGGIGSGLFGLPCIAPPRCRGSFAWLGLGYDGGVYPTTWTPILCRLTSDWRLELSSAGGLPMCIVQDY